MRILTPWAALLLLMTPASAGVRTMTLGELCDGAERIVFGGVDKIECRWSGQIIVTDITIVPIENLKGSGVGPFVVTIPGGTVGTIGLRVSEVPAFAPGEFVVVCLKSGTPCGVYGWHQGKFTIVNDQVAERPGTSWATLRSEILYEVEH